MLEHRAMSGSEEELVDEMKSYGLEVLSVSEVKMRGNGMKELVMLRVYIQGCKKVDLSQVWQSCCQRCLTCFLREWKCIDEWIMWNQLKIEGIWVMVIQVYAPTDDSSPGINDEFFQKLQETVGSVARVDLMVVMGDMNAKVGCNTSISSEVWGGMVKNHGEDELKF